MARRNKPQHNPGVPVTPDPVLQSITAAHHEPFALVDADFRIVAANQRYAEAYAGQPPEAVIGRKCHEISHKTETTCEING